MSEVDVWTIDLDVERAQFLSPGEAERAARFYRIEDCRRWSNARSALRRILARYVAAAPESLSFAYGPHGKPSLESGPEFNLSHSGRWAMIAVSPAVPLGIDIERIREEVDIAKLLRRIGEDAAPGTAAHLFQRWTRREAKTKALGAPLMQVPTGDLRAMDLRAPEGFAAALATSGSEPSVAYRNETDL